MDIIKNEKLQKLGINLFESEDQTINYMTFSLEMIGNGYLLTLIYGDTIKSKLYRNVLCVKSSEEVETILSELSQHLQ
jgi:hypothetical protein